MMGTERMVGIVFQNAAGTRDATAEEDEVVVVVVRLVDALDVSKGGERGGGGRVCFCRSSLRFCSQFPASSVVVCLS